MSIKINIEYFNGKMVDEEDLTYKSQNTSISRLMVDIAKKAEKLDELVNPVFKLDKDEMNYCGLNSIIDDIFIDLILIDNKEIFNEFNVPENSLGFHAINSGIYESIDDDVLSKKHRVFIMVDEKELKQFIKNERNKEFDPTSDKNDNEYIRFYLTTVTHELAHCVEFITNGNGLTPSDAANHNENGNLSFDLIELSTGHGILFPYDEDFDLDELTEIMEERVEKKGIEWLNKIDIDQKLLQKVLEDYKPEQKLDNKTKRNRYKK